MSFQERWSLFRRLQLAKEELKRKELIEECFSCGREIYLSDITHTNIQQKPKVKYFCSKKCKDRFSIIK